jgi:photosystem II stability/assembly factor-like uncharacterized protein
MVMSRSYMASLFTLLALLALLLAGSSQARLAAGASLTKLDKVAGGATTRYISARQPVQGTQQELAALRPLSSGGNTLLASSPYTNPWQLAAHLPGAVIKDISFPSPQIGYISAELGQVWKTTDGGTSWTRIMNLGFPYYWYGVHALDDNRVIISGFIDNGPAGVVRWSSDGGASWTQDITMTTRGWSYRVRFADDQHGLVMDGLNYDAPNAAHYTTNGGHNQTDWHAVVPDPNGGWFGNQFTLLPDLKAWAAGISYCSSPDGGANWGCRPSIDSVFDGPVFFVNDQAGWVGGGSISPTVEGWVHRTTDGGATWSGRTLDDPWPIREIRFVSNQLGWAAGGNYSSGVGGMYFSSDGGQSWALDVNTGKEMDACASLGTVPNYQVWCAGYDSNFNGVVYKLVVGTPSPTITPTTIPTSTAQPSATPMPTGIPTNTPTVSPTPQASSTSATTPIETATMTATPLPATDTPAPTSPPAPSATPTDCLNPFVDISGDIFYGAIHYLNCRGVINGTDATHYSPAGTSTRGQFAKVVVLGFGTPFYTPTGNPDFTDVPPSYFAYVYIETGFHNGILSGFDAAGCIAHGATYPCYLPNIPITRGQLTKLVVGAAHYPYYTPTSGQTFTDVPPSNVFYVSIETAAHKGVINGYPDGTFRPNNNIRRDEMAQIVFKGVTTPE